MTRDEINAEADYRLQERLGILCGSAQPSAEQLAIAERERDEYLRMAKADQPPEPTKKMNK